VTGRLADAGDELVLANRIVARERIVDAFGHVSVRDPEVPGQFLIARSLAPARVRRADLQWIDLDLAVVRGDRRASYAEVAIHAGIYRARPDVAAICHSHSPAAVAFGVSSVPLRPVFHMGSLIGSPVPVWDIRDEFGATDMLVRTLPQGASLARALGDGSAALMRGHGSVVAGAALRDVVHAAYALEQNARIQLLAAPLGALTYLAEDETERSRAMLLDPLASERAWGWFASRSRGEP
jgi:HCOMODA/2-hydroxy-3-carboxy-muconic semialdehyde decarboxylase